MTADEISNIIIQDLVDRQFPIYVKTFFGCSIIEADVFGINNNGYMSEYEVKRSRSDFFADFKKEDKHRRLSQRNTIHVYDEWKKGNKTGNTYERILIPNRFYYACESGLINVSEIPEYAGLVYIDNGKCIEIKPAPLLHRIKIIEKMKNSIAGLFSDKIGKEVYLHDKDRSYFGRLQSITEFDRGIYAIIGTDYQKIRLGVNTEIDLIQSKEEH